MRSLVYGLFGVMALGLGVSEGVRPGRPLPTLLLALGLLAPLTAVGTFGRALWTPDEPREADIAWRMSLQSDRVLASFDSRPWLEKPPLSYWLAGASVARFGDSPAALRLPNAAYSLIAAVAVFALAASMGGSGTALVATLVAGSALLAWRVGSWLAPDAALMAGIAAALLGLWQGWNAAGGRAKLLGYTLMHAGAAWGFLSKSAVGWVVPALVLGTLILWERRYRELARVELWAGLVLQFALIAPWIALVWREPEGLADLKALFWNNLFGRFADVPTYGGPRYATGHASTPGKYFIELPVYLLPWTALAVAALARAVNVLRERATVSPIPAFVTAWRFAIAASLPWLVLLSLSATARDVYAAPCLIGFALLIALALTAEPSAVRTGGRIAAWLDVWLALRATLWTVLAVAVALLGAGLLLVASGEPAAGAAIRTGSDASSAAALWRGTALFAIAATLVVTVLGFRVTQRAGSRLGALLFCYGGFALPVTLWGLAFFPVIDTWQDLARVAAEVSRDVGAQPLALLAPDETTIAMMDRTTGRTAVVTPAGANPSAIAAAAGHWFAAEGRDARLLVKLPGSAPGPLTRWVAARTGRRLWSEDDGNAGMLERAHVGRVVAHYALPEGRRYALIGPQDPPAAHEPRS